MVVEDKVKSKEEKELLKIYTAVFNVYRDSLLVWKYKIEYGHKQRTWAPKGRILYLDPQLLTSEDRATLKRRTKIELKPTDISDIGLVVARYNLPMERFFDLADIPWGKHSRKLSSDDLG